MITEAICVSMMVVGIITFCVGIFIESANDKFQTKNGLIMSLLGVLIIVLGVFALTGYRSGLGDGYRAGQIDGLNGVWKYKREFRITMPQVKEIYTNQDSLKTK